MEKITTTAEEARKYFVMLGTVLIGTTPISALADTGPMDWFYFRELAEFARFIDGHGIRYGEKSKVEGGTLALAMMGGKVVGYISVPLQVSNNYRYMVAIKAGLIDDCPECQATASDRTCTEIKEAMAEMGAAVAERVAK